MTNTALLVVSFGTTHLDTLEKTIHATELRLANAFPDLALYRAFTSTVVRKRLFSRHGLAVDSVEEALARIAQDGHTHVIILPTLLIPGEEYDRLNASLCSAAGNLQLTVCRPLLDSCKDLDEIIPILRQVYPTAEDTVLLLMGHGTEHSANSIYLQLAEKMRNSGTPPLRLCTVEGTPCFEDAVEELTQLPQRQVLLAPLLLVAGDHAKNDMAGSEPDSLRSLLEVRGFHVDCRLQGLGEFCAVQERYIQRVQAAL